MVPKNLEEAAHYELMFQLKSSQNFLLVVLFSKSFRSDTAQGLCFLALMSVLWDKLSEEVRQALFLT